MTIERQLEQPVPSEEEANTEDAGVQLIARRVAYKIVLAAVVIGIVTISALWLFVMRELSAMAESLQTIKAAIADLGESQKALGRQISDGTSQLNTLVKAVWALKVVKRKLAASHKPRPVKIPPFHIDAIDVWDDMTYVAVSQAGRMAFLKAGEQQSGWTVTRIDRLKGQINFQGPAGQVHSVSLQR